jgi:hypothetical protein
MFAREFLSSHRAALSASLKNFANSNYSRTYEAYSCKSNYSRTYATPGGGGIPCSQSEVTNHAPQVLSLRLFRKNRGARGLVIPIAQRNIGVAPPLFGSPNTGHAPFPAPVTGHQSLFTGRRPLVAGHFFPYTFPHEVNPK